MSGLFLGCTSTKQRIKGFAQGHNIVCPVRFESAGPEVIKLFMLNSTEHEISIAHKN